MRPKARWLLCAFVGTMTLAADAWAVVGRPFTPVSYAGVARRSSRRVARRTSYRMNGAAAMPYGCAVGVPCYGTTYQPVYQGTTVIYVEE
jgi:hypothetical protein